MDMRRRPQPSGSRYFEWTQDFAERIRTKRYDGKRPRAPSAVMKFNELNIIPSNGSYSAAKNVCWSSSLPTVWSSHVPLDNYHDVSKIDGSFVLMDPVSARITASKDIPPLHYETFPHLPAEILNCYISGACELFRRETMTFWTVKFISREKFDFLNLTEGFVLNFILPVLLTLEPISFDNLRGKQCPIDFDVDVTEVSHICRNTSLFDYRDALLSLVKHIQSKPDLYKKFMIAWRDRIYACFDSSLCHFVGEDNHKVTTIRGTGETYFKVMTDVEASGWLLFPCSFGLRRLPLHEVSRRIFPEAISDFATYEYCDGDTISVRVSAIEDVSWMILPVSDVRNDNLVFSCFELAVSLKYFVFFMNAKIDLLDQDFIRQTKQKIFEMVFDAIIAGSPFFYSHWNTVLLFLTASLRILARDTIKEYQEALNIFECASSTLDESFSVWITEQNFMINAIDHNCMSFFPEFYGETNEAPTIFVIPKSGIPNSLQKGNKETEKASPIVKELLKANSTILGYPIHWIVMDWTKAFLRFPEVEIVCNKDVVQIQFLNYIPVSFSVYDPEMAIICADDLVTVSYTEDDRGTEVNVRRTVKTSGNRVFLRFKGGADATNHHFIIHSTDVPDDINNVPVQYKDIMVRDVCEMVLDWNAHIDQRILAQIPGELFQGDTMDPNMNFDQMIGVEAGNMSRLISLRGKLLMAFNFLYYTFCEIKESDDFGQFKSFVSPALFLKEFHALVDSHCIENPKPNIRVDRLAGIQARSGDPGAVKNAMIFQFADYYRQCWDPSHFRVQSEGQPWKITYEGEAGYDMGGPARDFAIELINDILEPKIGLFMPTPNGRIRHGSFSDCLIPCPRTDLTDVYKAVGVLLGVSIRVKWNYPFSFPPLVWSYLGEGRITPAHIFEIDEQYKETITGLTRALEVGAHEPTEKIEVNEICNAWGKVVRFGAFLDVTYGNCRRFIETCHGYRMSELERPLKAIREGLWENLGFDPPPFISGSLLMRVAWRRKAIDLNQLRNVIEFDSVDSGQQKMFWNTLNRMPNDEREQFLRFATGNITIPEKLLISRLERHGSRNEDPSRIEDERLPEAATCFLEFRMPRYSSVDKMYDRFSLAFKECSFRHV
jgi:hypothetical protein